MIVALIPARGGSKGIPRKNIVEFVHQPLIVHSIHQCLKSKYIDHVVVSTDDHEIAEISKEAGAIVPFIRPPEISHDDSTDEDVFFHYVKWLQDNDKQLPEMIVHVRATYPVRPEGMIDEAISMMNTYSQYDSLRTIVPIAINPCKTYFIKNNVLTPYVNEINSNTGELLREPYNRGRQQLPKAYIHNGCLDIVRTSTILEKQSITGTKICPFIMESYETFDIDTWEDLRKAEEHYGEMFWMKLELMTC